MRCFNCSTLVFKLGIYDEALLFNASTEGPYYVSPCRRSLSHFVGILASPGVI